MEQTLYTCVVCGGEVEPIGNGIGKCIYCRSKQSIPTLNLEKLERANVLRREKNYSDSMRLYEEIISESPKNAEAYWGAVLCRYGIEFVEDYDGTAVPTCNRTMTKPITGDPDFKYACEYAEGEQKDYYIKQAEIINEIQNDILKEASEEKPYDVFISYKSKDKNGNPTSDSKEAMSLYYKLDKEGYKAFFAEKTLKPGKNYEPQIYSALSTSKVMILIGSSEDNINSAWVKNEWSRYLDMTAENKNKILTVVYYDMDPENLPMELKKCKNVNWKTPDAMSTVMDTIKKYAKKEDKKKNISVSDFNASVDNVLYSRMQKKSKSKYDTALLLAKSGNINAAMKDLDELLISFPDYAEGHWLKLCLLNGVLPDTIAGMPLNFQSHPEYLAAVRFAGDELRKTYETIMETCLNNVNQKDSYSRELYTLTQSYCSMDPANTRFNSGRIREIKQILSDKKIQKAYFVKPFQLAGAIVCLILLFLKVIGFFALIGDPSMPDDGGFVSLIKLGMLGYMAAIIFVDKGAVGKAGIGTGIISIILGFAVMTSSEPGAYISIDSLKRNNYFDIIVLAAGLIRTIVSVTGNKKKKKSRENTSKIISELNQLLSEALNAYQTDAGELYAKYNNGSTPLQPIIDPSFSQMIFREREMLKQFDRPIVISGKKKKQAPRPNNQPRR